MKTSRGGGTLGPGRTECCGTGLHQRGGRRASDVLVSYPRVGDMALIWGKA